MGPRFNIDMSTSSVPSNSNGEQRGTKRTHADTECTDSCDCEEFGMPLAKKINQMNIEFDRQRQRQGTGSSGSSSVSPQNEKSPDEVPVANCPEFLAKYPFSKESPYYNSNLLLSSLYQERIERNPHLRHNP